MPTVNLSDFHVVLCSSSGSAEQRLPQPAGDGFLFRGGGHGAAGEEERAVVLVLFHDVLGEPDAQEVQQLEGDRLFAAGQLFLQFVDLVDEVVVLLFVVVVGGVAEDAHQALFHGEVDLGVVHQFAEDGLGGGLALALVDGAVQLVEQFHQELVLVVDFLDADAEFVAPFDEGVAGGSGGWGDGSGLGHGRLSIGLGGSLWIVTKS